MGNDRLSPAMVNSMITLTTTLKCKTLKSSYDSNISNKHSSNLKSVNIAKHLVTFKLTYYAKIRVPTEIKKIQFHDFSMICHDQQCNFHDYIMTPTSPFSSNFTSLSINVECSNNSMLVDHACILK